MVNAFILFVMFLMTIAVPIIAIVAELSKSTPNTVFHSVVRSIVCIGSLLFLSQMLQRGYLPCGTHFLAVAFIFLVSCIELILEMNQTSLDKLIHKFKENRHTHE